MDWLVGGSFERSVCRDSRRAQSCARTATLTRSARPHSAFGQVRCFAFALARSGSLRSLPSNTMSGLRISVQGFKDTGFEVRWFPCGASRRGQQRYPMMRGMGRWSLVVIRDLRVGGSADQTVQLFGSELQRQVGSTRPWTSFGGQRKQAS